MLAIMCTSGVLGGTALTCIGTGTKFEKQLDLVGILIFIGALGFVGFSLSPFCR